MPLKLNTASSGSVTIDAANTASNFTLTVPAQTGTAIIANSDGNVGIGTSSPANFGSATTLTVNNAGDGVVNTQSNGTNGLRIGSGSSSSYLFEARNLPMRFLTNSTEQARITADGLLQFNSGYGSVATAYGCRVWVNFNGTGTVAIRNSGNVSSITDNGTGDYTVNFSTAMPDVNYCVGLTADFAQQMVKSAATFGGSGTNPTTSAIRVFTRDGSSSASDSTHVYVAIFR
jgi:hypothetical protein